MKVRSVEPYESEFIITDQHKPCNMYVRKGEFDWSIMLGGALSPFYKCEELEEAYQEFKKGEV